MSESKHDYDRLITAGGSPASAAEIMKAIHYRQFVGIDTRPVPTAATAVPVGPVVAAKAVPVASNAPVEMATSAIVAPPAAPTIPEAPVEPRPVQVAPVSPAQPSPSVAPPVRPSMTTGNWKTARVLDSTSDLSSYVTGSTTNTAGSATVVGNSTATTTAITPWMATTSSNGIATAQGRSTSSTVIHRVTVQTNQLLLAGDDYLYIIEDERMQSGPLLRKVIANHRHGCRFVVGEDVKYRQEKGDLYVLDADGKQCKTTVLRQEKRQPLPPR